MPNEASEMLEESQQKTIKFIDDFLGHFEGLCMNENFSDVVFIVQTERIHANRAILAARSEYFRAMLFSGLAETHQREVELKVGLQPFKVLLKFFYTGSISLSKEPDKCGSVLDIFELAHFYDLKNLVSAIYDFLNENLGIDNAGCILNFAVLHKLDDLREDCLKFLKWMATEFLQHPSFKMLSKESLEVLLESDAFCPPEVDIFRAVVDWHANNLNVEAESIFSRIRLSSMDLEDVVRIVQPTNFFSVDKMFGAVSERVLSKSPAYSAMHAVDVVDGINQPVKSCSAIFNGVRLELKNEALVNHVRFNILHGAGVHYVVDVSVDNFDWERVIDYRKYTCKSLQYIYFEARQVRFIKVVAHENAELQIHGLFHITDMPRNVDGVVAPTDDVFTSQRELQLYISPSMVLALKNDIYSGRLFLPQPINISSIRLFDVDHKAKFFIETSIDGEIWSSVYSGKSQEPQTLVHSTFSRRVASYIRILASAPDCKAGAINLLVQCPAQSS